MTWMLPSSESMTTHHAHWVPYDLPYVRDRYLAACGALVGPRVEVEPGERCHRCQRQMGRRHATGE